MRVVGAVRGAERTVGYVTLGAMTPILSIVTSESLRASVHRVAAATDRPVHEPSDLPGPRVWAEAGVVVVSADVAQRCIGRFPRRTGVVLVADTAADLAEWQVATSLGAEQVLTLPDDEIELLALVAATDGSESTAGAAIAVLGACGGAGASLFAAAVAVSAEARNDVLLVDGDMFGCGLDVRLGVEDEPGIRWPSLHVEGGHLSARALRDAAPVLGRVALLSTDRRADDELDPSAVAEVVDATRRTGALVACDLGRPGPVADAVLAHVDLAVLVCPARIPAALAGARRARWMGERCARAGVVVRGPSPGGVGADEVARAVGLPLWAAMRPDTRIDGALERGRFRLTRRSALAGAARRVVARLDHGITDEGAA